MQHHEELIVIHESHPADRDYGGSFTLMRDTRTGEISIEIASSRVYRRTRSVLQVETGQELGLLRLALDVVKPADGRRQAASKELQFKHGTLSLRYANRGDPYAEGVEIQIKDPMIEDSFNSAFIDSTDITSLQHKLLDIEIDK